ncbi:MAG: type II secretion system protein GspC [Myxococcota bacterium]
MSIDGQLKRFFPLVVLSLLATAAYFQASGIGQLIGTTVRGTEATPATATTPPVVRGNTASKTGKPILARNPFDSVTGPLDGKPAAPEPREDEGNEQDAPVAETSDEDPKCTFGKVVLISASTDPAWSFAAIDDGSGSKLRRQGDEVSGHTLQQVAWDTVWFTDTSDKSCKLKLGDEGPPRAKAKPKTRPRTRTSRRRNSRRLSDAQLKKISKVSETEYNVERSLVDELIQDQAALMKSARITPVKENGQIVGVKLRRVTDGTLLHSIGLRDGDQLRSINGFALTDPQKALEAYGRLQSASNLKVDVIRNGSPTTIELNIQ